MFDIGMPEMIVIFIVALIVIGPKKLPEVAKALGKGLAEFKKTLQDVKDSVNEEFEEATSDIRDTVTDVKRQIESEVEKTGKTISGTLEEAKEQVAAGSEEINKALENPVKNTEEHAEGEREGKK